MMISGRALALLLLVTTPAWAEMHVMASSPAAEATMDGKRTSFFIRFDGPVDHNAAVLEVVQEGRVVQTLRPRLQSQPNVIYSGVRTLAPGAYGLRWRVKSMKDGDLSEGMIPFTVAPTGSRGQH